MSLVDPNIYGKILMQRVDTPEAKIGVLAITPEGIRWFEL